MNCCYNFICIIIVITLEKPLLLEVLKTRINIDIFDHLNIKRKSEFLRYANQSEKTSNRVEENITTNKGKI